MFLSTLKLFRGLDKSPNYSEAGTGQNAIQNFSNIFQPNLKETTSNCIIQIFTYRPRYKWPKRGAAIGKTSGLY